MALLTQLVSFEFEEVGGILYQPEDDFDFTTRNTQVNEAIQPIVKRAFEEIKMCLAHTVEGTYYYGRVDILNINNYIHIASSVYNVEVEHTNDQIGRVSHVLIAKFYRLEPKTSFKVSLHIEEMPSTIMDPEGPKAFRHGLKNHEVAKFAAALNDTFKLNGKMEVPPILKRGRAFNRYLISSDERVLEYDFEKLLFHKKSEFQDIKILQSPSFGNTLLLDDLQNLSEVDLPYTNALMDRGNFRYRGKEILILGGGDGGLLYELLKEEPKFVTMVDIDPVVIEACREYLRPFGSVLENMEGPRHKIIVEDCIKILRQDIESGKKYDVIFSDLTDVPVSKHPEALNAFDSEAQQKSSPWHFIETIFNLSLRCLAKGGVIMTHATGSGNKTAIEDYHEFLRNNKTKLVWESRSSYVPSFMEIWMFYTIRKHEDDDG